MRRTGSEKRIATALAIVAALALGACGSDRDPRQATTSFGDAIGRFRDRPISDAIAAYGPPNTWKTLADGRTEATWRRKGRALVDWQMVDQDCALTMVTTPQRVVLSVVAGGNSLFCADQFGAN
jgi:hypothetical protein